MIETLVPLMAVLGLYLGRGAATARASPRTSATPSRGATTATASSGSWFQAYAAGAGLQVPELPDPEPFDARAPERVELADVGVVILAGGFRPDYRAWLPWPEAFDDLGFPLHTDGASTVVPGLYFVGCTSCGRGSPRCSSAWARTRS